MREHSPLGVNTGVHLGRVFPSRCKVDRTVGQLCRQLDRRALTARWECVNWLSVIIHVYIWWYYSAFFGGSLASWTALYTRVRVCMAGCVITCPCSAHMTLCAWIDAPSPCSVDVTACDHTAPDTRRIWGACCGVLGAGLERPLFPRRKPPLRLTPQNHRIVGYTPGVYRHITLTTYIHVSTKGNAVQTVFLFSSRRAPLEDAIFADSAANSTLGIHMNCHAVPSSKCLNCRVGDSRQCCRRCGADAETVPGIVVLREAGSAENLSE